MIAKEVVEKFLNKVHAELPRFKGAEPDDLLGMIYGSTGAYYKEITKSRPHQLEGTAFALYMRRALLFYWMRLGKALRANSLVATPNGWRAIKTLAINDAVYAPSGETTKVTGIFPQGSRIMYRVLFNDHAETICDGEHLWEVQTPDDRYLKRPWQQLTTLQILEKGLINKHSKGYNYFVPLTQPIRYPKRSLPIDPYLLGVFLGDGCHTGANLSITTDLEIIESLTFPEGVVTRLMQSESDGIYNVYPLGEKWKQGGNPFRDALKRLGLTNHAANAKFIPKPYLIASIDQRKDLLAGLLDTDGWQQSGSNLHWGSVSHQLALDMQELVRSLGGIAKLQMDKNTQHRYKGELRQGQTFYHMSIRLPTAFGCPFRFSRKAKQWKPFTKFFPARAIKKITMLAKSDAVCITVADPSGLFVIKDYVVTHNSKMALDWATQLKRANLAKKKGLILAHAPMGAQVWLGQIETHSDLQAVLIKSGKDASDNLVDALESDVDLIILSISTLQSLFTTKRKNKKGVPKLYPAHELLSLTADYFDHAIIDEIHYYSSPYKLSFTLAAGIVESAIYRLGLTGTPIGRDPFKVWAQAYLIDEGKHLGTKYNFFTQVFGKKSYFSRNQFDLEFNKKLMPQLQYKLDAISLAYGKDEVQSAEVYQGIVKLEMTKDQQTVYNEAIKGLLKLRLDNAVEIEAVFVKLRMIASGYLPFKDDNGTQHTMHFSKSPKLEYLAEMVAEMPRGMQCVIFHEFTHSGELICKTLDAIKATHAWIWGGAKDKAGEVAKFKSGKARFLVANTATGGTSIDLPQADYLCFFESPCSPIVRAQAQARPMARGMRPLVVDDLICAPVEEKIAGFIKQGNDLLRMLISGKRKGLLDMLRAK